MEKTALLLIISLTLFANTKLSQTSHVSMDIYANKSFLNKEFKVKKVTNISTIVPSYVSLDNLKYSSKATCKVQKLSLSNKKALQNKYTKKYNMLLKKKIDIKSEINALLGKEKLLKSLSLENEKNFSKMSKMSSYLVQNLIMNAENINLSKEKLKEINEELKNINIKNRYYKVLNIKLTCNVKNSIFTISYPQNNLSFKPFYNINANTSKNLVSIEKKATINYNGIEDFKNIDLNLYSYYYNKHLIPQKFYPKYLSSQVQPRYKKALANAPMMDKAEAMLQQISRPVYTELETKSMYKIKNTKLISNENNFIDIDKDTIKTSFRTVIDAYGTQQAYLQAKVLSEKNYAKGYAKFFLNNNPIGNKYITKIEKNKEKKLYFGSDEFVQIKKELVKTSEEKTFFSDKDISKRLWKYSVKNMKNKELNIDFIERLPISKDTNIKVKVISEPKFDYQNAKGKLTWNFKLKPQENKTITFGYEISKEKNK